MVNKSEYRITKRKNGTGSLKKYLSTEKNVVVPETISGITITAISEYAFKNNSDIEYVALPESIHTIGKGAFYHCENLREIPSIKSECELGEDCFYCCESLKSVYLSNNFIKVSEDCFYGCKNLERVVLDEDCTIYISGNVFSGCLNLKKIGNYTEDDKLFASYLKVIDLRGPFVSAFGFQNGELIFAEKKMLKLLKDFYRIRIKECREVLNILDTLEITVPESLRKNILNIEMKYDEFIKVVKQHLEETNLDICNAYFYSGGELRFSYTDSKSQKEVLDDDVFDYWEDGVMVSADFIQGRYEDVLEELGVRCAVVSIEYFYEDEEDEGDDLW